MIAALVLASAVASGVSAGFFFAFSVCVMRALGQLPPAQGIAAMQSINVAVLNPWFLSVFFGTPVLCALAVVAAVLRWPDPRAIWWLLGGVIYIAGTFIVTILCNVPRNDALASVDPASDAGAGLWARYLKEWTAWNHVRTVSGAAAATSFAVALLT